MTKQEYLPGATTIAPIDAPDSQTLKPCGRLSGKDIPDGPDIDGAAAVKVAASWGEAANNCRDKNLILIGWIKGVVAATRPAAVQSETVVGATPK